jgi:predicted MFS family arabinose efflux permease
MLGCVISGLGPFIPFKAEATGLIETAFGVVFTSRGVGYVIGSLSVGKIEEKYNAHRILSCSFLIVSVTAFLTVSAEQIIYMCVIFFFSGLGCSGI